MRPLLYDVFSGAGGCAVGYDRAGFRVVGIDNAQQPRYPFAFERADALHVLRMLLNRVIQWPDAIHCSPPCQSFTAYRRKGHGVGDAALNLIPETRRLLKAIGLPYVIENVVGAPLENPVQLCGSSFGLDVRRHRLFETNWPLLVPPCDHSWQTPRFAQATNRANQRSTVEIGVWRIPLDVQKRAMGIDWDVSLGDLSQMVPPAYTEFIGAALMAHLSTEGNRSPDHVPDTEVCP